MQQAEIEAWNQGVHGLVKSVDPATGVIVVSVRVGAADQGCDREHHQVTVLKRYAPGSVTLRSGVACAYRRDPSRRSALGSRNEELKTALPMAAQGIVSGSFNSITGTVLSVDTAASTVTVKDLATKKPVTVRHHPDAQLRQLDDNMAAFLAARLKGMLGGAGGRPAVATVAAAQMRGAGDSARPAAAAAEEWISSGSGARSGDSDRHLKKRRSSHDCSHRRCIRHECHQTACRGRTVA